MEKVLVSVVTLFFCYFDHAEILNQEYWTPSEPGKEIKLKQKPKTNQKMKIHTKSKVRMINAKKHDDSVCQRNLKMKLG